MFFKMKPKHLVLIFICIFAGSASVAALNPSRSMTQYMQTVWTTNEGLPSDNLMDVIQDSNGFIWIGSYEGLIRFDGVEFKTFSKYTHPDFNSTSARILYKDHHNNLWIGTNGEGVARYSNDQFTMYTTKHGLPDNSIRSIFRDSNDTVWVGTTGGLGRLSENADKFESIAQFDKSLIELIYQDRTGRIWVGPGDGGIYYLKDDHFVSPKELEKMSGKVLLSMVEDQRKNLWIGTKDNGLFLLKNGKLEAYGEKRGIKAKTINDLWVGRSNSIWVGSDSGIFRIFANEVVSYNEKSGLNNNLITALVEDKERNLWVSTARGGLSKLSEGKFLTYSTPEGLIHKKVNTILEDQTGLIWIGTDGGLGLFKNGRFLHSKLTRYFEGVRIRHLRQDKDGTIWVSTYSNLGTVSYQKGKFTSYSTKNGLTSNRCRVSLKDSHGNIWIGTSKGLNKITSESITTFTRSKGLDNDYIMTIFEDSSRRIWIGTDGGGIAYYENGTFKSITAKDGLAANIVFKIFEDSKKHLWISTNGGISRYQNGKFFNFTVKEGLKSDSVFQGIEDNRGQLWMTANIGVFKIPLQDLHDFAEGKQDVLESVLYDTTDGLRASITPTSWGIKLKYGRLCLPTMNGIVIIDPEDIKLNPLPPPIYLDQVLVDDNPIQPAKLKILSPQNKRIVFKFTALSYMIPEKVRFQYKLKGFEDDWSEPSFKREASYTSLPAGNYTFRIRAANNDHVWSESAEYAKFRQKPFYYQTITFYLMLAAMFTLSVALVYYVRVRTLRYRQKVLERLLKERTKDLEIEKENYRGIVEDQTELICRFGSSFELSFANETFCRFFVQQKNELIKSNFFTLILPEAKPEMESKIASLSSNRQSITIEIPVCPNNRIRWVQWTIRALLDSDEQLIEYQSVGRDITERIQMEKELIKAKVTAEDANQAKSDFLADISHEIRTPIHAILGYTRLGVNRVDSHPRKKLKKFFSEIDSSGKRLVSLVSDLLDLSKLQTGKTVYAFEMNSLSATMRDVINEFQALAEEKNITLEFIDSNLINSLMMDKNKIRRVLTNLLSNAIKFSEANSSIEISLTSKENQLFVSIKDNGMGIPQNELETVFEKFIQSSKTTVEMGGTGLGLSISKQIITDHKGKIWAENNRDGGSTFHFTLPAYQT